MYCVLPHIYNWDGVVSLWWGVMWIQESFFVVVFIFLVVWMLKWCEDDLGGLKLKISKNPDFLKIKSWNLQYAYKYDQFQV